MSPLWRDQIRIVLCPRQVALLRLARGWSPRITGKRVVSCDATKPGEAPWRNALAALATALPEFSRRKADVFVVLSNHFVRYALVMHSNEISTAGEEQALVRHYFTQIYGSTADRWALRLGDTDGSMELRVASAVDQDLLDSLRALFQSPKLKLRSIQPYLMAAFNQWRQRFKDSAWFALVEPDRLCLAKFQNDRWLSIKTVKIDDDWIRDLTVHLDREKLLSGLDTAEAAAKVPVFVFAPGCSKLPAAQVKEHAIELLRPLLHAGAAETAETPYAMALTG